MVHDTQAIKTGKGHKVCKVCGSIEGPRAFHCKNGHGFIVKGVKQPDIINVELVIKEKIESSNDGRGIKLCKKCGTKNGVRSWHCKSCGTGFLVKGVQHEDIDIVSGRQELQEAKHDGVDYIERRKLLASVRECSDPNEARVITRFYNEEAKTYESLDGKYRIRFGPVFMGVRIDSELDRPYKLMYRSGISWELVPGKNRFKKLVPAIKRMKRLQDEEGNTEKGNSGPLVPMRMRSRKLVNA